VKRTSGAVNDGVQDAVNGVQKAVKDTAKKVGDAAKSREQAGDDIASRRRWRRACCVC
jgi:hypothetical protein